MNLCLVRHGDAVSGLIDHRRPLSEYGQSQVETIAQQMKLADLRVGQIVHSSLLRAQQTAEVLGRAIMPNRDVAVMAGLMPDDSPTDLVYEINTWREDTMIVGHLPFMPRLAGLLVTGSERHRVVDFATATAVYLIEMGANRWMIQWALSPQILLPSR